MRPSYAITIEKKKIPIYNNQHMKDELSQKLQDALKSNNVDHRKEAFAEIYSKYASLLHYIAYGILANDASADDAVSQTFQDFIEHCLSTQVAPHNIKYYLVKMVKNLSSDELRKNERNFNQALLNEEEMEENSQEDASSKYENNTKLDLSYLNENEKRIVAMHAEGKMTIGEIARLFHKTPGYVKGTYQRAKAKILSHIEAEGETK
jgi:RNA polymerase sigma factor (sigma-70 family)